MKTKKFLLLLFGGICLLLSHPARGQTCSTGSEVNASAGGTATAAASLTVYNSTEAGPDGSSARAAVDLQDDAWRNAILAMAPLTVFNVWSDTSTAQGNVSVPQTNAFSISGVNVSYDYRDLPSNYRTVAAPCMGSTIAAAGERVAFLAKTNTMQGSENAPRPAFLYDTANQPIVYDEISAGSQPGRNSSMNAVVFSFSSPIKAFGAWFGDVETRTDGGGSPNAGMPMIVRLLDSSGQRIGSDVRIQPRSDQSVCGDSNVGCGNQTTRWIGFHDTVVFPRVSHMVVIAGFQGGSSTPENQRLSFIGPTIPIGASAAAGSISGRVSTPDGRGIRNVRLYLQNASGTIVQTALSSSFGYYEFPGLPAGDGYFISVIGKKAGFSPSTRYVSLLEEFAEVDFVSLN
jgi:hypothetical protein